MQVKQWKSTDITSLDIRLFGLIALYCLVMIVSEWEDSPGSHVVWINFKYSNYPTIYRFDCAESSVFFFERKQNGESVG